MAKYRLGLDMGTNSIGWTAIKLSKDGEPYGTLDMGVRIFPDGRNPTDKASNAVNRRVARGQRRRRDRYLLRRKDLIGALVEYGLMPEDKGERDRIANDNKLYPPYELRARALDRPLEAFELGRAIFHLAQRRGFKSNRKSDGGDENEAGKTRADISELRRRMEESGARTLGEYMARRLRKGKSVRARPDIVGLYPERAMYEEEFDRIRDAQESHQRLSEEEWDRLHRIIFRQRDLKPVDPGWCLFEDGEKRAARALPVFQEFRIFQEVNNLRIQDGVEDRALNDGERERALKRLRSGGDINLEKPVNALGLPWGAKFNLAAGGRKLIKGDETAVKLAASPRKATKSRPAHPGIFGGKWLGMSLKERNGIVNFLLETEEPEVVRDKAIKDWGLNDAQADAVANVSLASGYGNLSEKAIERILPHLEMGKGYSDAVIAAGYPHHSDFRNETAHEKLPYYGEILQREVVGADPEKDPEADGEAARYGRIGNPTVHIGLNQLRRVVNRVIEEYGKPEEIVVELARDLKMNDAQKRDYQRRQRDGGERNDRLRNDLEASGGEVTEFSLRKLRLWEEQGNTEEGICPYTGQELSFDMVVSAQTEIDHILPFSRTLDNSMSNMVVCVTAANRAKGNRSPYEAFGHNPPGYDYGKILENVAGFPANKRWRFQPDAMDRFDEENAFLDRQLTETQYLARTARTYLAHLYNEREEGQKVRAIPGRMTALLRRGWGLNGMLSESGESQTERKQRDDHRHHAIDAFVVANTTQGMLQSFARAAGSHWEDATERLAELTPKPWEGFDRNELRPFLDNLVVSYKPDRGTRGVKGKTTGQLHNDTAYGIIKLVEGDSSEVVRRKPLTDFKTKKHIEAVRDPALREELNRLWEEEGGKAAEFAKRAEEEGVRRVRVVEKQRVIPITDDAGKPYKGYLPGGNEFADIWRMRDGSWKLVVVPAFDANQPGFNIEKYRPVTTKGEHKGKPDSIAKRIARLQIDDIGALGEGAERRIVRVRKITGARSGVFVVLDDHNEANVPNRVGKDMRENRYSAKQLKERGFRKVYVDEIGRVRRDPGQFKS